MFSSLWTCYPLYHYAFCVPTSVLLVNKSVSTITKLQLMTALVWPVATHGCEAWTQRKQEEKCIQAFENKCIRKLLRKPWTKLMTTAQVYKMAGTENELLNYIKSRKLRYFRHVMRQPHDNTESSVMVGLLEGVRNRGRQGMSWLDNICQWTGLSGDNLLHTVRDRRCWTSLTHPCSQSLRSYDGEMTWHDFWQLLNIMEITFPGSSCTYLDINFILPQRMTCRNLVGQYCHSNWNKMFKNSPNRGDRSSPDLDPDFGWPWKTYRRECLIDL